VPLLAALADLSHITKANPDTGDSPELRCARDWLNELCMGRAERSNHTESAHLCVGVVEEVIRRMGGRKEVDGVEAVKAVEAPLKKTLKRPQQKAGSTKDVEKTLPTPTDTEEASPRVSVAAGPASSTIANTAPAESAPTLGGDVCGDEYSGVPKPSMPMPMDPFLASDTNHIPVFKAAAHDPATQELQAQRREVQSSPPQVQQPVPKLVAAQDLGIEQHPEAQQPSNLLVPSGNGYRFQAGFPPYAQREQCSEGAQRAMPMQGQQMSMQNHPQHSTQAQPVLPYLMPTHPQHQPTQPPSAQLQPTSVQPTQPRPILPLRRRQILRSRALRDLRIDLQALTIQIDRASLRLDMFGVKRKMAAIEDEEEDDVDDEGLEEQGREKRARME